MKEFIGYDSWKRPIYKEVVDEEVSNIIAPAPTPKPVHINNYVEATPKEVEEWRQQDYWNRGDYDPMVMFVVIPAIIQLMAMAMMGAVMFMNSLIF